MSELYGQELFWLVSLLILFIGFLLILFSIALGWEWIVLGFAKRWGLFVGFVCFDGGTYTKIVIKQRTHNQKQHFYH